MRNSISQIYLNKNTSKLIKNGSPWAFFDSITNPSTFVTLTNSDIIHLMDPKGDFLATAIIDKLAKLAIRVLDLKKLNEVDSNYFYSKFAAANKKRTAAIKSDYYRLINYEGDDLPGLCIERFGKHFKIETNLEFYNINKNIILEALTKLFSLESVTIKYNLDTEVLFGSLNGSIIIEEGISKFNIDIMSGQKTGWYFDQRQNRQLVAELAIGKNILDCFCYTGGFGIYALNHGAKYATFIDSSASAISILKENLRLNQLTSDKYNIHIGNALRIMQEIIERKDKKFDMIILDPPPLIKNKVNKAAAIKKYSKICSLGLALLNENGYLFYSSCSHYMSMQDLKKMVESTALKDNYNIKIITHTRHAYDHPIHNSLPQSQYLNSVLIQKD